MPSHIGIIMDGNGRWAQARGLKRIEGHKKGMETVREITKACRRMGVKHLVLYAFSEENWKRPRLEVAGLMSLLVDFLKSEFPLMMNEGIRLRAIGNLEKLPMMQKAALLQTMNVTQGNTGMDLVLALSYGGREELVRAFQNIGRDIEAGKLTSDQISAELISQNLDTAFMPDPDLVVRTSGEFRTSNFLPWQTIYSEFFVTPTLWPDFTPEELETILRAYEKRERRFGMTSEQLQQTSVS